MHTENGKKIRLVIADDHPAFRQGLAKLIQDEGDIDCVGQASDGVEAVEVVRESKPDVVVVDACMPRLSGIEAVRQIKAVHPDASVLVLSAFDHDSYILPAMQAGASGYMLKSAPLAELVGAIRLANKGDTVLIVNSAQEVLRLLGGDNRRERGSGLLQPRELEVLKLAARGMSNREISQELSISERTVHSHLHKVFRKLGTTSRTQAVLYALNHGWIASGEPVVSAGPFTEVHIAR